MDTARSREVKESFKHARQEGLSDLLVPFSFYTDAFDNHDCIYAHLASGLLCPDHVILAMSILM